MQGTIDHEALIEATGHSHVTLTALRYADPDAFSQLVDKPYERRINLQCVTLCASQSGIVKENRCDEHFKKLHSFRSLIHAPNPGDSLFARWIYSPIRVSSTSPITDEEILEREYQLIRQWEVAGELFVLDR